MTVHEDVFATVAAFQATNATTDQEIVDELVARGYDSLRAELLAVFVPLGLARALIARLPANPPLRLPETAIVLDGDRQLIVQLASVPEFQTARHIGEETFASGVIPKELFSSVVAFSVELKLINQALYAGEELGGSTFAPPVLIRLADAPGFERWCQTISARAN
jgi:aryl carrier-like protein